MMPNLIKQPSAWIPIAMSTAAFLIVMGTVMFFGVSRESDEGTAAHLFQLLLAGQLPFVVYFAIKWLPKKQNEAIIILVFQAIAGVIALAPVFLLGL